MAIAWEYHGNSALSHPLQVPRRLAISMHDFDPHPNPLQVPRRPVIAMHDFYSNAASVEGSIYLAALTLARRALNVIYTWPVLRDFVSSAAGVVGHIYLAALTVARLALKVIYTRPFVGDLDSSASTPGVLNLIQVYDLV